MTKTESCLFCNKKNQPRKGRRSLFCCNDCRDEYNKPAPRFCQHCGKVNNHKYTNAIYCSKVCRVARDTAQKKLRNLKALKNRGMIVAGELNICALKTCGIEFVVPYSGQKYCSEKCRQNYGSRDAISTGEVEASRIYFGQCKYCQAWKSTRAKTMINRLSCLDCQKRRMKENDTRKNHSRRAAGDLVMTVQSLAERDGTKCNICLKPVNMSKSGLDPLGPTIDHLLPVSKGGTNDSTNLALAHRRCNTARGNRGHAQLLLEITDAWATTKTA